MIKPRLYAGLNHSANLIFMGNWIPKLIFKIAGWKAIGGIPPEVKKCVLVAAPHTSNWDFVYGMCGLSLMGIQLNYLAKKELFRFPIKRFLISLGGIAVDRSKSNSMVDSMVKLFNENERLILMVPPEGTRKKVDKWKTGFYYTALNAKVPILLGILDYGKKEAYIGKLFEPTGDIKKDFEFFREFYKNATPKNADYFSVDCIRATVEQ